MKTNEAIEELRSAINYIDKLYGCDDRDLSCPNPDGLSIALKKLETVVQQPLSGSQDSPKSCEVYKNCRNGKLHACTTCNRMYPECNGDWYKPIT